MSKDLAQKQNEIDLQNVQWDLHEVEESKPLEFTEENKAELFGLEPVKATEMVSGLSTTLAERQVLKDAYVDVISLEITTENLSTFKELRLKIMKNRTQGLDKWKEKEKAFYLAGGRFVDSIYNKEVAINQEMESKLLEAEKFFENQEKERKRVLNEQRLEKLKPYIEDVTGLDFSEMNDYDFEDYVLGKKTRFENEAKAKKEAEEKAEAERLAEIERQKAIEAENAKLKAEAEEKEKQLAKERAEAEAKQKAIQEEADKKAREEKAKQDAILKAEQEAKAKIEAELQAKKDAEIKAEAERLAKIEADKKAAEKLAKAGQKKQLETWIDAFQIEIPEHLKDDKIANDILSKFWAFKSWAKKETENL